MNVILEEPRESVHELIGFQHNLCAIINYVGKYKFFKQRHT